MIATQLAIPCRQNGINRTFATIGHRAFDQLGMGHYIGQTGRNGVSDFFGTQAVFERVGGNHDFHGCISSSYAPMLPVTRHKHASLLHK